MKNVILGSIGCMIVICTLASCLSIYSISARKNEMEKCMAQVLEQNLRKYYQSGKSNEEVSDEVRQDLVQRMNSKSDLTIVVHACDMEKGILSVGVTEKFNLPGSTGKVLTCDKTIIAE